MHDDGAARLGDGGERGSEPVAVALEEVDVRPCVMVGHVGDGVQVGVELGEVVLIECGTEHRDVDDLDVDVARRVLRELLRPAQVDDPPDAVLGERAPAGIGQPTHVVRSDDNPFANPPAVLGRQAAEIARVQAALPGQRRQAAAGSAPR